MITPIASHVTCSGRSDSLYVTVTTPFVSRKRHSRRTHYVRTFMLSTIEHDSSHSKGRNFFHILKNFISTTLTSDVLPALTKKQSKSFIIALAKR